MPGLESTSLLQFEELFHLLSLFAGCHADTRSMFSMEEYLDLRVRPFQ